MNQINKIRVEPVEPSEGMAFIRKGVEALTSASMEELQASLVGMAETFIQTTTECPDENTQRALCMEVIANTIENNRIYYTLTLLKARQVRSIEEGRHWHSGQRSGTGPPGQKIERVDSRLGLSLITKMLSTTTPMLLLGGNSNERKKTSSRPTPESR